MTNKISIRSVKIEWLNTRCLMQISKYTKDRFDLDSVVMNLRDPSILQQVVDHARQTDNPELQGTYKALKKDIKACLMDESLSKEVIPETIPDYLIERSGDSKVSRKEVLKRWFNSRTNYSE